MRYVLNSRDEWLEIRKDKITATRCVALLGLSKYINSVDVYQLIKGIKQENDNYSKNDRIQKGAKAEEHIRSLFLIRHCEEYKLIELEEGQHVFFIDDDYEYIGSSCDGEIEEIETGKQGLFEIKFFDGYQNLKQFSKDKIRDDCYAQLVHEMRVAKKDFGIFIVALNYKDSLTMYEYYVSKEECEVDAQYLLNICIDFNMKHLKPNKQPSLVLDLGSPNLR